jgi:type IV secretion system protein VirB1
MSQIGQPAPNDRAQPQAGRIATDPATAALMSQVGVSAASPAGNVAAPAAAAGDNGVFVPQVRGPNEAAPTAAPAAPAPKGPDQADLRVGARDDAFVF